MILDDFPKRRAIYSRIQKYHCSIYQPAKIWDFISSLEVLKENLGVSRRDFEVVDEVDLNDKTDSTRFF